MDLKQEVTEMIIQRMAKREFNTMKRMDRQAFGTPLVGISSASDSMYDQYKEHIGAEFYRRPEEWLESRFGHSYDRNEVSVVSWILPQTEPVRAKCRELPDCPCLEWEYVRVYGEECNRDLALAVESFFARKGLDAVAPMCSPEFAWFPSDRFVLASNWSERHTAHIAGLGTFGLCDGLITPVGKAVRIGSCIVAAKMEPDRRPYTRYNEYCLADQGCRACIERCPAGAISRENGHDKPLCRKYHAEAITPLCKERYGYEDYAVCGLCQTGVPCEAGIPKRRNVH